MENRINELYGLLEDYATSDHLENTKKALRFIRTAMTENVWVESAKRKYQSELCHCLETCLMVLDLKAELETEEEDMLLSAVLLHIYPENFQVQDLEAYLVQELGFSGRICEILEKLQPHRGMNGEEMRRYYQQIEEDRLALLAALADRANLVQHLYQYSTWDAHRYIDETRVCYFPMCIYGKEHYHSLLAPLSILMDKMRSLLEVTEILLRRYEVREEELIQDILALKEENATIRGIIAKFKAS